MNQASVLQNVEMVIYFESLVYVSSPPTHTLKNADDRESLLIENIPEKLCKGKMHTHCEIKLPIQFCKI